MCHEHLAVHEHAFWELLLPPEALLRDMKPRQREPTGTTLQMLGWIWMDV